ncbi:LIM and calponin homology domains-containing protein 1 isoform X1 [Trichosurus vulpecula]|uniref:LIM and calponin homology domains-containing protein 1 isoform X1 n=1 Tax=Trichosurus vulpecula TaxID=9337 RepID=UPI00186B4FF0|nr:LIM and calponin homology domains-containing protein 1 isoform X1 [Trichosurus vulpecula]
MASLGLGLEELQHDPPPEPAFHEAQKWIEQVTGRSFGDRDFRTGLENGILLCELLNAIKPGLVKKINRLPTPIAGLDNIILFLRGCKELGLKESQLFDPGDLQDTSNRVAVKSIDCSRKLKNVLVTIYWLGKAANSCTAYSGTTLNLKEFEGLLAQMRKETDDIESPKRSIRDSGYIDCWDSERSDSLSPPRHGRDDSFDSLDSFGSRSQQTPSPDVVLRGSSDGRGSDSESDLPHRKLPDVKKDDMSARRTSHGEPKSAVPFNQYLPNKSNQTAYVPAPLRRKKAEREEYRKSWSTATSPLGGERTFSYPETIEEEEQNEVGAHDEEEPAAPLDPSGKPSDTGLDLSEQNGKEQSLPEGAKETVAQKAAQKDLEEMRKRRRLEQAGIKIMPAAQRFASQKQVSEEKETVPDIILRKENPFLKCQSGHESEPEDGVECRLPDLEKDDFAARRARMNQTKAPVPLNQLLFGPYIKKENDGVRQSFKGTPQKKSQGSSRSRVQREEVKKIVVHKENLQQPPGDSCETEEPRKAPDIQKDDLAKRKIQSSNLSSHREPVSFVKISNITEEDMETWDRLKVSGKTSDEDTEHNSTPAPSPEIQAETAVRDDFAKRKARAYQKASSPKQKFVHFGPVTEIDQQKWRKLSIGKVGPKEEIEEIHSDGDKIHVCHVTPNSAAPPSLEDDRFPRPQNDSSKLAYSSLDECCKGSPASEAMDEVQKQKACILEDHLGSCKEATSNQLPQYDQKEDRLTKGDLETELKNGRCGSRNQQLVNSVAPVNGTTGAEKSLEMTTRGVQLGGGARGQRKMPDPQKDDMMARRTGAFLKHPPSNSNQFLPVPFAKQQNEEESPKGLQKKEERYGPRTAVSDDAESVSMLDMRCEEEAAVQPHSKARQEQLQFINSQLKEEDDKWQDDLARWKSRRRSASQDLIKKEAERKKMERLLAGGDGTSERRKSIKTYREIVQEKERRERELHEAYKNARSREEAEGILQQYIERFTISEAVLERLEMPKILERSHSTEPNSSLKDPNPMKYLRQQSLPPPKFTATVETTIARPSELDPSVSAGSTSPSKTVVPKAVPMLTPKPYHQPKNTQQVLKTFKVDEKVSVNGETFNGVEEEKERECPTATFSPSLTRSQRFEGVARVDDSPVELKQDGGSIEISIKKASSLSRELTISTVEEDDLPPQKDETDCGQEESRNTECDSQECQHFTTTVTRASPTVAFVEFNPSHQPKDHETEDKDQRKLESEMSGKVELVLSQKATKPKSPEPKAVLLFPYLNQVPETNESTLPNLDSQVESNSSEKSPASTPRFNLWAWDPEEERRRQEKWQLEQERLLQERYQKEQDKLKEEWEKAQKEVEEEERRYYEEERKIIEDTVVPFTISSSSADQISTSSSVTEGNGPVNKMDLEDSKEEEKRQRPLWEEDSDSLLKNKKSDALEETRSRVPPVTPAHPETSVPKGIHQDHQLSTAEPGTPDRRLNLELSQDTSWNQPWSPAPSHALEDVKPKTLPVDQSINHQVASPSERRKTSPRENFRAGQLSPCSPTPPGQSPSRSISGKKLCSACGLPLGKGAAMIIETLSLYFHIQCFRCGICKGQLGDSVSGTDVRIRNGLLNCNECYIRSRSAGQPTTL